MNQANRWAAGTSGAAVALALIGCGNSSSPTLSSNLGTAPTTTPDAVASPPFGQTAQEAEAAEQARREQGEGKLYVIAKEANISTRPGGATFYVAGARDYLTRGEEVTVYARHGHWVRMTDLDHAPRWVDGRLLSKIAPPDPAKYDGPKPYQDSRIAEHAIPNPGERNLTKAQVDTLWKGAKMVLQTRGDCSKITSADYYPDLHDGNPPYYVTCMVGEMPINVFFNKRQVADAKVQ